MNNWGSVSRLRKVLYGLSVLLVVVPFVFFFLRSFPKYLTGMLTFLVPLPLYFSVPLVIMESGACAVVITEMIRPIFPSGHAWSDRKHFLIVGLVWLITLTSQMGFFFMVKNHAGLG